MAARSSVILEVLCRSIESPITQDTHGYTSMLYDGEICEIWIINESAVPNYKSYPFLCTSMYS